MIKWYEIKNKEDKAEVWIYDVIGETFFGEGVAAKSFVKELADIKASQIDLHINSPGGSVWDGHAIYNSLISHPANITSFVEGRAASIASVVALAGNKVVMANTAMMMIHNPRAIVAGTAVDIRSAADVLDKVGETIQNVYVNKTGESNDVISKAMDEETWFTATEAVEFGLADEVSEGLKAVALAPDVAKRQEEYMARYKNVPDEALPLIKAEESDSLENNIVKIKKTSNESDGASDSKSDGASQEETETNVYDFELEKIKHRR